MKKLNIAATAIGVVSVIFMSCYPTIRGNGNLVTSENIVSTFEKINIAGSPEVHFYAAQEYRTVLTTDENLTEYVEIYTRGNTLNIGTKNGRYKFTKFSVDVYCPVLIGVSVSGSGSFSSDDTITVSKFDANVSGSGSINGTVECRSFSSTISGSGSITIFGNSENSDITISGSGHFNGLEFVTNNVDVVVSGSGEANINVLDNLDANISGSGKINYRGNPKVDSKISGSGKIKKI